MNSPSEQLLNEETQGEQESRCVSCLHAYVTCGNYKTEVDACKAFDEAVIRSGAFKMWKEVNGIMTQPKAWEAETLKQRYRIDRVLSPTSKFAEAGWNNGLIGVEIKRSNIKIGGPWAQSEDYLRCLFTLPLGIQAALNYVFIFPAKKTMGATASKMAQSHTGTCCLNYGQNSEWHRLEFFLGEQSLILCSLNTGGIKVANLNVGNRTGSR